MNMPTPPTDNLYKFLALSGLAITIFFTHFTYKNQSQNDRTLLNLEKEQSIYEIKKRSVQAEALTHKKLLDLLEKKVIETKSSKAHDDDKIEVLKVYYNESKELRGKQELLKIKRRELEESSAVIKRSINEYLLKLKETKEFLQTAKYCSALGIIITIFGFKMWYSKVQKIQDELLKQELSNTKG